MQFYINIPVAPGWPFFAALGMVMVIIHRLQMFGGFAFLAETIIQTRQDFELHSCFGRQFQSFLQHEFLARLAHHIHRPRAFPKEIRQGLWIESKLKQTRQVAQCFSLVGHKQGFYHLQQMSYLGLVKCEMECKDKTCERFRMLYNHGEHWNLWIWMCRKLILPDLPVLIPLFWRNYST